MMDAFDIDLHRKGGDMHRDLREDKLSYAHKIVLEKYGNTSMGKDFRNELLHGRYGRESRYNDDLQAGKPSQGPRIKAIISGSGNVEIYRYQRPLLLGKKLRQIDPETGEILNGGQTVSVDEFGNPIKKDRTGEAKRTNARRSKMELRRLVKANFSNGDKFLTLTFREGSVNDVSDVAECNKAFNLFCKKIARRYPNVKYCRVIEFQDQNNRGAVHYHVILSLPYVPYEQLGDLWGNGYIGINAIDHVDNVGAYIQKYMAKDFDDPRLCGKKAFATSQNVVKPQTVYGAKAEEIADSLKRDPVFKNAYESEWNGKVTYEDYNESRDGVIPKNPFRRGNDGN